MEVSIKKALSIENNPCTILKSQSPFIDDEKSNKGTNKRINNDKDCSYIYDRQIRYHTGSDVLVNQYLIMSFTNPINGIFGGN